MIQKPYELYQQLIKQFGKQNWWPIDKEYHEKNKTDPRFEIIIGAILTQNTAWSNVEKALSNLKTKKIMDIKKISEIPIETIAELIRPSGYYNQKAVRLKNIAEHLKQKYEADLDQFFNRELQLIRQELLSLNGIGSETADSILLYAGSLPIFVVDAYTKRICQRIPLKTEISYDKIQEYFQKEISKKNSEEELTQIYNELHALIVVFAKKFCKKKPNCTQCIIQKHCNFSKQII